MPPWFNPPLDTLPLGVSMLMIWGRKAASSGSSCPTFSPEPADRRCTVSGPSACSSWAGWTGAFDPVDTQESTCSPKAARPELAHQPVDAASPWTARFSPLKVAAGSAVPPAVISPPMSETSFVRSSISDPPCPVRRGRESDARCTGALQAPLRPTRIGR